MSRRRKMLILAGIVLVVAILIPVIRHYQLRSATEAYIAQLKAQGVPLELSRVVSTPLPPEENGAPLITNALTQIYLATNSWIDYNPYYNPPYDMNQSIPGGEMLGWRQPFIHGPDTYPSDLTNTWQELGSQLSRYQSALNDFWKLIQKPALDFHVDYSNPQNYVPALASHLARIKIAIFWLEASEFYNLNQNKTADACTDVRTMLAFVKGETDERFEISQLVRFAIAQISVDATWNILQAPNVSDSGLVPLQQDWQSLKFTTPLKNALFFERVSGLRLLNNLRQWPTNLDAEVAWTRSVTMPTEGTTDVWGGKKTFLQRLKRTVSSKWDKFQWRWFWFYADKFRGLQMWQVVIDGTSMLETNRTFPFVQSFVEKKFNGFGFNSVKNNPYAMLSQNAHGQIAAIRKLAGVETARNIVITAIALKRYELQHHHFPDRLDALVPEFLKSVPTDYMNGRPLHYRRNADGTFLLYSVGLNGKDDGGNPALEKGADSSDYYWLDAHALDWVWPQPATPAEIQKYYERHSKDSAD